MKFELWAHKGMTSTQLLKGLCSDGLWRYAVFWSFKNENNGWILTWDDGYVNNQTIASSSCDKSYPFCPIEGALLRMSCHSYLLGEEVVGKAALTGHHCWISVNEIGSTLGSTLLYKYQEDWQLQFAAGIKTVLLVPVIPHGVLQLGSLDTVFESAALVALIKDSFYKLYDASVSQTSVATMSAYSNTLRPPPTAPLSISPQDARPRDLIHIIGSSAQILTVNDLPFSTSEHPILEDITIGSYRTPDGPLDGNGPNGTLEYEGIDGFTLTHMAHGYQEYTQGSTAALNEDVVISKSSFDSEFHEDLEAMSREEYDILMLHSRLKKQEPTSPALLQVNGNNDDFHLQLETNNYAELLLDAIIDQVGHSSNSEASPSSDSPLSCEAQIKRENHASRLDELSVPDLHGSQELSPIFINEGFMDSALTDASPKEINETRINRAGIKRRCRKVELQRARPRDRQLIQDRMKGLRELIPNASKSSIDALLDKTIAYTVFLQSVSDEAEKINGTLQDMKSRDEAIKQLESCPLRVEELDQPGHLLIEMLCGDYQVFLEMAHVLKGLEVSILKGVMERRSERLWARFVIKASQGFNQMQILFPLMHLLHRR